MLTRTPPEINFSILWLNMFILVVKTQIWMEKLQFVFRTEISAGRYIDLGGETGELECNIEN